MSMSSILLSAEMVRIDTNFSGALVRSRFAARENIVGETIRLIAYASYKVQVLGKSWVLYHFLLVIKILLLLFGQR